MVKHISIGDSHFDLTALERDGQWIAHAVRGDGDRCGIECAGVSEADAIERLTRSLEWQHEHAAALDAVQRAEDRYHRTIAGSAFAGRTEGPSPLELQKESLDALEAARLHLEQVRARKPPGEFTERARDHGG
jgi:hypothetical protein